MNRRIRTSLVAVCAAALLVSCGGEGDEAADTATPRVDASKSVEAEPDKGGEDGDEAAAPDSVEPYAEAIATSVTGGQFSMEEGASQCFGEGVVEEVGLDKLRSKGSPQEIGAEFQDFDLVSLDLAQADGEAVYDKLGGCGYDMRGDLLESLVQGEQVDARTKACIEDAVQEERLRAFMVTMMTKGLEAGQKSKPWKELEAALIACEPAPAP